MSDISANQVKCLKCGMPISSEDTFCRNCGTKINKNMQLCGKCGKQIVGDMQFCTFCGASLKKEKESDSIANNKPLVNEKTDDKKKEADEINKKVAELKLQKEKRKKLTIIITAIVVVVGCIFCGILYYSGVQDEETLKALSKSLEGATFYSYGSSFDEKHKFGVDGQVYSATDFGNDGEYTGSYYYYGLKKLSDGRYGIDFCVSEEGLFKAGEDRMYIVTEIENDEIISYENQDDYSDTTIYTRY